MALTHPMRNLRFHIIATGLSPAHDRRATNCRGVPWVIRRGVPWVFSPLTGLVHQSEARSPRTGPRSHAEPCPAKLSDPAISTGIVSTIHARHSQVCGGADRCVFWVPLLGRSSLVAGPSAALQVDVTMNVYTEVSDAKTLQAGYSPSRDRASHP